MGSFCQRRPTDRRVPPSSHAVVPTEQDHSHHSYNKCLRLDITPFTDLADGNIEDRYLNIIIPPARLHAPIPSPHIPLLPRNFCHGASNQREWGTTLFVLSSLILFFNETMELPILNIRGTGTMDNNDYEHQPFSS